MGRPWSPHEGIVIGAELVLQARLVIVAHASRVVSSDGRAGDS